MNNTFWAGGFLYNPRTRKVLLHKRDGNTLNNPNKWAFFGGTQEETESPKETFIREFKEETEIEVPESSVTLFITHSEESLQIPHHVFFAELDIPEELTLHEGSSYGWFTSEGCASLDMVDLVRVSIESFFQSYESR